MGLPQVKRRTRVERKARHYKVISLLKATRGGKVEIRRVKEPESTPPPPWEHDLGVFAVGQIDLSKKKYKLMSWILPGD